MRSAEARQQRDAGSAIAGLKHGIAELPGGKIHYVEAGTGSPLVLVHGGHGSWTHWLANIAALARSHRVIAPDLPGYGASYRPEPELATSDYGAVLVQFLDALGVQRTDVAGFSFGSVVATLAARQDPQRIDRLVLVSAPGLGPPSPHAAALMQSLTEITLRRSLRCGALESLKRVQLFDHALIDDALVDRMLANVRLTRFVPRDLAEAARAEVLLAGLHQPLLVLLGREDIHRRFGLAQGLAALARCAPRAQVWLIERAAHWLQYDRAAWFNGVVRDFLR